MADDFNLITLLQARIAMLAIGASTLRNQGAPGVVRTARTYMAGLSLGEFSRARRQQKFEKALEKHTRMLASRFPAGARGNWGAARKALNIFLRDVIYNRQLCSRHRLAHLEPWLELPLDKYAYRGLVEDSPDDCDLPAWPTIKALDARVSGKFQSAAEAIAKSLDTYRVHLDVKYWRRNHIRT